MSVINFANRSAVWATYKGDKMKHSINISLVWFSTILPFQTCCKKQIFYLKNNSILQKLVVFTPFWKLIKSNVGFKWNPS